MMSETVDAAASNLREWGWTISVRHLPDGRYEAKAIRPAMYIQFGETITDAMVALRDELEKVK